MVQFIVDGGPPSILVLVFGTLLVVFSALYARSPAPHRLRFVKGLSVATTWIMVGGFAAGARVTLQASARLEGEMAADMPRIAMMGIAESLAVVVLGTGFLTLAWFVTAIGLRRPEAG